MTDFGGVFEVLAADEEGTRLASRKALLLAEERLNTRLAGWLGTAKNAQDYESVYNYSKDLFETIVRVACDETGFDKPEAIAATLKAHYAPAAPTPKTASVEHTARRPRMCPYHNEVVDISLGAGDPQAGYNAMSSHTWGPQHCQGGEYGGGKCNFKREMVTQSFWDDRQKNLDEKRELRQEQTGEVPLPQQETEVPQDTIDQDLADDTMMESPDDFGDTGTEAPMDLTPISEPTMALASSVQDVVPIKEERDEVPDRVSASPKGQEYSPSEQRDESGKKVPCPQCGGDGKTASNQECSKCEGSGKVSDWGPSTLDALNSKTADGPTRTFPCKDCGTPMERWRGQGDLQCPNCGAEHNAFGQRLAPRSQWGEETGESPSDIYGPDPERIGYPYESKLAADGDNTGLGGPEPKIDKAKWTPENVKKYDEESKEHPTKEKDPVEPIKAKNDDELEEIGEKTTERVDLPTGSEDKGGGFADGGESKAPGTKTFPKGKKEVDPVTKESISSRMSGDQEHQLGVGGWWNPQGDDYAGVPSSESPHQVDYAGVPIQSPDNLIDEHASGLHYDHPRPDCPSCQGTQSHPYDLAGPDFDPEAGLNEGGWGVHSPHQDWTR